MDYDYGDQNHQMMDQSQDSYGSSSYSYSDNQRESSYGHDNSSHYSYSRETEDDKKDEPKKEDRVMEVLETVDDALEDVEDLVDAAKFGPYPESSTMITQESIDNLQSTSTGNLHLGNAFIGNEVLSLGRHSDSIVDEKSSLSKRDLISCSTEGGMNDSDDECCSCDKPLICLAFLCDCFGI